MRVVWNFPFITAECDSCGACPVDGAGISNRTISDWARRHHKETGHRVCLVREQSATLEKARE